MAFRWCAHDGPTSNAGLIGSFVIFKGIRISIAKELYIFVIFQGGGGGGGGKGLDPLCPPLDPHMTFIIMAITSHKFGSDF